MSDLQEIRIDEEIQNAGQEVDNEFMAEIDGFSGIESLRSHIAKCERTTEAYQRHARKKARKRRK